MPGRKRKADARTFGQDIMRGEHVVGSKAKRAAREGSGIETNDLRGGLTFRTTINAYKEVPAGEPVGKWSDMENGSTTIPAGLAYGEIEMFDGAERTITGTSIFDPVLCELVYRWFCPPGGLVLDPFAGGSVRGIVAAKLGRRYVGIDLRPEQNAANEAQAAAILGPDDPRPIWITGNSRDLDKLVPADVEADLVFSCPPYGDLERYSDDPRDLSTMRFEEFGEVYAAIIMAACRRLKRDRYACFVVGDYRDERGIYRGFPWLTVAAFEAAGLGLYNEAVLVTAIGSLPVRVNKQFDLYRKLGKTHQNVLVFLSGDAGRATAAVGPVEFGALGEDAANAEPGAAGDADPAAAYGEIL